MGGRKDAGDEEDGEAGAATAFRRNRGAAGVEGDAATSTKETATSADALTRRSGRLKAVQWRQRHCFAGEDASPVISPRNGGEAGEEEAAATPGEVTAQPDGARARRERRLEAAGAKEREGRRRERSSGGLRGKWRASRGRGGGCEAEGGGGAASQRTGKETGAAGGGRRHGRERKVMGRWLGAWERAKWTKGRRRASFYRARTECRTRERPKTAPEEVAGGINGGQRRGIKSR
uniref:BKRF1 encodes EBNA-1 protein-like n=2 Tax=Oryza sativa subsp. japonica TaxID=39947 RepID=A0A5S6R922_ORYSJ|nr:Hypothetical protein [Oryza sativa Japonica Group]AAP52971.1 hypothetical protein LOC_Os10g17830 [Oryza sativa Japonica Group]